MSTRILVLDDHPSITRSCAKILTRAGYEAVQQNNSLAALELLAQETFDLLLTDIRMPEMDGIALLEAIREKDPHLSVVVITGFGTMEDAVKAMRLGAQGFLLKPYDPEELVAVVQENLQRRDLIRDSIRLQTLLPLLKLGDALQGESGAAQLSEQALQVAAKEIVSGRLQLWLKQPDQTLKCATDLSVTQDMPEPFSLFELRTILDHQKPLTKDKAGHLGWDNLSSRHIYCLGLPLLTTDEGLGVLVAAVQNDSVPLSNFQLELLQVLSRQLAVVVENINLFYHLESLRAFNDNIIENISTGLIVLDHLGYVTVLNKAAAALLGLQLDDLVGRLAASVLSHFPELAGSLMDILTEQTGLIQHSLVLERKDGELLTVTITVSALYDADEKITGVVGLIEDFTELKALEAESRRLDRLAALGEMSAVVAHELRNPIAGVAAGVEYLSKRISDDDGGQKASQMIQQEIQRVHRIIEDIMMVARPLNLQKDDCSLPEIIKTIHQRHQPRLQASRIQVELSLDAELPLFQGDLGRLEQVFDNLMSNAIAAMPNGGDLTISAEKNTQNIALSNTDHLTIWFKDTGNGIKPAQQQKIFEPFFTTKNRGVGLGLALSRRIVEAHGGKILIGASDDTGTTFEIQLPLALEANNQKS
ncbi:MAG: response regulator [Chloroflexota bacterium]